MAKQTDNNPPSPKTPRKGTTLWLCIIFFVSAWMFVLGVLVGRGTAPVHFDIESLQKELAALKDAVQQKELQWYKNRSETVTNSPDLEFHEALRKNTTESRLGTEKPAANLKKIRVPERNKPPESKPEPAESHEGRTVAFGAADTAGVYTIQVAALREANFADVKVAELTRKGYPAYRTVGTVSGRGTWYRVRIGSFKDRISASRMLERLKRENIGGIIVQK